LRKSASETFTLMQQAYDNECLSQTTVYKWYRNFRDGSELLETDQDDRFSTSITDENVQCCVRDLVAKDWRKHAE
ncbi:Putative uncharacterized protein FLJ37770, partial [Habropoda laboriosa]